VSDLDLPPELVFGVDLASIRDRLIALGYFLSVTDLTDAMEAIDEIAPAYPPAAFVSTLSEAPQPNKLIGGFHQLTPTVISILFVEPSARADRKQMDRVEKTRRAIIRQLVGWTATGAARHFEYAGYSIRAAGDGLIWAEVKVRTEYFLTLAS